MRADYEDTRPTYDDLAYKMQHYARVVAEMAEAQKLVDGAKSTMASHQRDVDRLDEKVQRLKQEIKQMLGNLKE